MFMNSAANRLKGISLTTSLAVDLSMISEIDKSFGHQLINLLSKQSKSESDFVAWKALLMGISKRLEDRILSLWAIHFYQELDLLIDGAEVDVEQIKTNIIALHAKNCDLWEKYLDEKGWGIFPYIKELIGKDLSIVFSLST